MATLGFAVQALSQRKRTLRTARAALTQRSTLLSVKRSSPEGGKNDQRTRVPDTKAAMGGTYEFPVNTRSSFASGS
jgi:hypothetical protein